MKIDGTLISGLADPTGVSRAMVETIVHVSHSLGICTVAESVETGRQVRILRELNADVGQGYFFAPPMAVNDAHALTTKDPLPVFALTGDDDDDDDELVSDEPVYSASGMAAEVMGALDAVGSAGGDDDDARLNDDILFEADDMSLVSKRGRLMGSFRRGR
jgi:hypothetical protein